MDSYPPAESDHAAWIPGGQGEAQVEDGSSIPALNANDEQPASIYPELNLGDHMGSDYWQSENGQDATENFLEAGTSRFVQSSWSDGGLPAISGGPPTYAESVGVQNPSTLVRIPRSATATAPLCDLGLEQAPGYQRTSGLNHEQPESLTARRLEIAAPQPKRRTAIRKDNSTVDPNLNGPPMENGSNDPGSITGPAPYVHGSQRFYTELPHGHPIAPFSENATSSGGNASIYGQPAPQMLNPQLFSAMCGSQGCILPKNGPFFPAGSVQPGFELYLQPTRYHRMPVPRLQPKPAQEANALMHYVSHQQYLCGHRKGTEEMMKQNGSEYRLLKAQHGQGLHNLDMQLEELEQRELGHLNRIVEAMKFSNSDEFGDEANRIVKEGRRVAVILQTIREHVKELINIGR